MNTPPNGTAHAQNHAERHAAAHRGAPAPAWPPVSPAAGRLWLKLRLWLPAALLGALVGGVGIGYIAYTTLPVRATPVERVFADVNGDGAADLIVSGWVIYGPAPKAAGQ